MAKMINQTSGATHDQAKSNRKEEIFVNWSFRNTETGKKRVPIPVQMLMVPVIHSFALFFGGGGPRENAKFDHYFVCAVLEISWRSACIIGTTNSQAGRDVLLHLSWPNGTNGCFIGSRVEILLW